MRFRLGPDFQGRDLHHRRPGRPRAASRRFGDFFAGITSAPYWNIIQIVIGGVIAILILLFIWRLAECAGFFGHYGMMLALPGLG